MPNDSNRPVGFYIRYLQRLHEQRERAGLSPAADICDDAYWQERKRNEELKQQPRAA
jgi:hypothetical protein